MKTLLKFGNPNAKLKALAKARGIILKTFSLPSGWTCPGAKECLSKANKVTGKIKDGKDTEFRCFQASAEAVYPSLRKMVWHNFETLLAWGRDTALGHSVPSKRMEILIRKSLKDVKFDILRVHVGGDYFSKEYLQAWVGVAECNPEKIFYSYSKSLPFFLEVELPSNLILTASRGGKFDNLIEENAFKEAVVVFSEEEAASLELEIDHDDSHALGTESFALLLHGTQPKGSIASKALSALRAAGKGGYSNKSTATAQA